MPRTKAIINSDTVELFPQIVSFPQVKLQDYLKQAASDIAFILTKSPSTTVPALVAGDETRNDILQLASILKRVDKIPNIQDVMENPLPRVLKPIVITPPKATSHKDNESNRTSSIVPYNPDEIDKSPPRVPLHDVPMRQKLAL